MTIATTTDLIAAVGRWLRRADLAADIPTFIQLTEAHLNRVLKLQQQIYEGPVSITGEFVALPTGNRQIRGMRLTSGTSGRLDYITPEQMIARKSVPAGFAAEPQVFTLESGQFEFYPVPDKTYSATATYQIGIPPLSANATNWLLTDHPDVYLYGALTHSAPFIKADDRLEVWKGLYETGIGEVAYALRAMFDNRLKADPGLLDKTRGGAFNILTGE